MSNQNPQRTNDSADRGAEQPADQSTAVGNLRQPAVATEPRRPSAFTRASLHGAIRYLRPRWTSRWE